MATRTRAYFNAALTTAANVSTGCKGELWGYSAANLNTSDAWLQVFNVPAASVTLGTTTPIQSFLIPKGNGTDRGAASEDYVTGLILDGSAISVAATTTEAGATPVTTGLEVNIRYR